MANLTWGHGFEPPENVINMETAKVKGLPFAYYVWVKAKIWFFSASGAFGLIPKE
ncbi:MAG: hypothetical protein KAS32_13225 [Candidatus Peribacteraceae bacterium]|nr:hypothetical protein [Candidatus Peribacteraceae bacterium]